MGMLDGLVTGGSLMASMPGPTDDFWYQNFNVVKTASGMRVDAEGARKISAWYRGRDILATSLAMLPLHVYRRLPNDGGREVATGHPLEDILHRKPNVSQDSYQWRKQLCFDVIDTGWGFCPITAGKRGFVDTLPRIDPLRVTPKKVIGGALDGQWIFTVRPQSGVAAQPETFRQDEMFFLRGTDGKGILEYARESLGIGLILEQYAARIFSRGTLNGGYVETPGAMPDDESMRRFARQFMTAVGDWHLPKVIPFGAKFATGPTLDPEKAQMILSRKFSVIDIARWLGLPAHMLNEVDTAGVTGLEQKGEEFVTFNLGGWLSMWEFAINDQLILAPQTYYAEFTREALARANMEVRSTYDVESVNAGIETPDEIRARRNLPKMGGKASELREPQNITGKGAYGGPQDNQRPGRTGDGNARAEQIAVASAQRLLKNEVRAVQRLLVKHANSADDFAAAVAEFYAGYASIVSEALLMTPEQASEYCSSQAAQVLADWRAAVETWQTEHYAQGLAALALEAA